MEIYTDGACSGNGKVDAIGGWGMVAVQDEKDIYQFSGSQGNTTNQRMELTAAIYACKWYFSKISPALVLKQKVEPVIIYSDSAYLINCVNDKWWESWIKNGWKNSKKQPVANKDLWAELIPFFKDNLFIFKKVKGHVGNKYNELADSLAVSARKEFENIERVQNGESSDC